MLVNIGRRAHPEGLVDLLLACHGRIRSFGALALAVGRRTDASPDECREASERCRRYFGEALPLHVADEEESLLPRLRGVDPALDEALRTMATEHDDHAVWIAELLDALQRVGISPDDDVARADLVRIASHLVGEFERHLEAEERLIVPRIPVLLSPEEQNVVLGELRARRRPPSPPRPPRGG